MKLQRAFRERKVLTEIYTKITDEISSTPYSYRAEDETRKKNVDELFAQEEQVGDMLARFNAAIDKANGNSQAKEILSKLTQLRRKQQLLQKFEREQRAFVPQKKEFDSYLYDENGNRGKYITIDFKKNSETNFEEEVKKNSSKIRKLEDQLSEINYATEVEVPKDILEYLENQ